MPLWMASPILPGFWAGAGSGAGGRGGGRGIVNPRRDLPGNGVVDGGSAASAAGSFGGLEWTESARSGVLRGAASIVLASVRAGVGDRVCPGAGVVDKKEDDCMLDGEDASVVCKDFSVM